MKTDAILTSPVDYDWTEGYTERWDLLLPSADTWTVEQCRDYMDERGHDFPDPNPWNMDRADLVVALESLGIACYDDETDETLAAAYAESMDAEDLDGLDEWRGACNECIQDNTHDYEPLMSYYYPLPDLDSDTDPAVIEDLPLVIVEFLDDNAYGLALTGGGMDLSWEICEAFTRLGYLPPFHFCRLPLMAGKKDNERNRAILAACSETCAVLDRWIAATQRDLQHVADNLEG